MWDAISRTRESFLAWMQAQVLGVSDFSGYLRNQIAEEVKR
jgi:hypothetical protein